MTAEQDAFQFTNDTGVELTQLLFQRVREYQERSAEVVDFSTVLGPALIVVAEVLRRPIEAADNPAAAADDLVALTSKWLRTLLEPVAGTA